MGSKRELEARDEDLGNEGRGENTARSASSISSTRSTSSTSSTRSRELIETLRRVRSKRAGAPPNPHVELSPGCAYGVQSRQILDDLKKDVDEVKLRLNGLIFLVAGAVVVDVVIKLAR